MQTQASDRLLRILLVEDNEGDFILVSEYLNQSVHNCSFEHKTMLEDALQALREDSFDIILLDLTLPDSNGADSIIEVVALAGTTPVIVLTGNSDKQFGIDSLKLGVEDYLVKDEVNAAILSKSISYSIERKKNQLQLARNERRFRALIENSTDGLMVIAASGVTQEISPMGKKILGHPEENLIGKPAFYFLHPDDRAIATHAFNNVLKTPGQVNYSEFRIQMPDGQYKWIENTLHNLLNEPSVAAIVANFRDITERKVAEETIRESEEKYRFLFNRNPQVIYIWNPQTLRFIDLNDTCISTYGYSREEFEHLTLLDIRDVNEHDRIKQIASNFFENDSENVTLILPHRKKNGELMHMEITSHRVIFNGTIAVLSIANNVTEKIHLERELENEKIKKQQEITGAVISAQEKERQEIGSELHDNVNQILASARLYIGLVKKNIQQDVSAYLNETENLISTAINELRKLSHTLIPPSMEEAELLEAITQLVLTTQKTTNIQITHNLDEFRETGLPDKMKLAIYRIIQEQFNNILKYASARTIRLLLTNTEDGNINLSIKDDGAGFDTSKKSKGVGLMNMKVRASLFNGETNIISSPGQGCELQVYFRLKS